jgi:hypothetical protein
MKKKLQETSARSKNERCYTMEINAWKTPYADGIARICAYQQSRRHVYFLVRSVYLFLFSIYLSFAYLAVWLWGCKTCELFLFPTWPISLSCRLCLHDVRERQRQRDSDGGRERVHKEYKDTYSRLFSLVFFNITTQSKELVEGLQKLVQHFDARGLPVAGSGPRSSM